MPKSLLAAIAISTLLALMLSIVPTIGLHKGREHIPVFQAAKPIVLHERNLVDLFTYIQTHYNIKRVKWENKSLFVDLVVRPHDLVELPLIYRDFYTLAYDVFLFTQNADHLFFRVLEEADEGKRSAKLLVSIQADRPRMKAALVPPEFVKDLTKYVEEAYPVRIEPYFRKRVSP
jgi:hypothetical protein